MRTVPDDLAKRYEAEGWWTQDTIGDLLARGLAAAPETEFHVHSATCPWSGTFGVKAPRYAEFLHAFPLNATGKVMKEQLK